MALHWLFSPAGIHIRGYFLTARESVLDWDSALGYMAASAGVGTIGDLIGAAAAGSFTTTIRISRTAGRSSIAIVFVRLERSIAVPVLRAGLLAGMSRFMV